MNALFLLLRIGTALTALLGILLVLVIIFLRSLPGFAKHLAKVIGYVAQSFASAFTKGTPPEDASWVMGLPQVALGVLFAAMVVSVFLPGAKIFLHIVAGCNIVVLLWYGWMTLTDDVRLEIYCLPTVLVWLVYYLLCIFWFSRQQLAAAAPS